MQPRWSLGPILPDSLVDLVEKTTDEISNEDIEDVEYDDEYDEADDDDD